MKAKDYLDQVEKLDTIIKNKLIERAQWRDVALGVTARSDGERVQASGSKNKLGDAVAKAVDIEAEIDALVDKLIDAKKEITATIELLNATEYDVLHMRYIQHLSYTDIADAKCRDYNWVTTVHGRALKNVQAILDERERHEIVEQQREEAKGL